MEIQVGAKTKKRENGNGAPWLVVEAPFRESCLRMVDVQEPSEQVKVADVEVVRPLRRHRHPIQHPSRLYLYPANEQENPVSPCT